MTDVPSKKSAHDGNQEVWQALQVEHDNGHHYQLSQCGYNHVHIPSSLYLSMNS